MNLTISQSLDVEGVFVAHVLDFDIVTQGVSVWHAIEMAIEATEMVLTDDVENGRNSQERRAPEEFW